MTKKGDTKMMEKNTSVAPMRLVVNCKNAILAALHVLVLTISLAVHPLAELGADRALP